jgi:hypothetical protein
MYQRINKTTVLLTCILIMSLTSLILRIAKLNRGRDVWYIDHKGNKHKAIKVDSAGTTHYFPPKGL